MEFFVPVRQDMIQRADQERGQLCPREASPDLVVKGVNSLTALDSRTRLSALLSEDTSVRSRQAPLTLPLPLISSRTP